MKKIKQAIKSRPKKIQVRSKTCGKAQHEKKKEDSGQLSVFKHQKEHKFLKKDTNATVRVEDPNSIQSVPKPAEGDTKPKKIFQTRMSPSWFVGMINNFNEVQRKAIRDMGFGGFLHLQVTELQGNLCNWLVGRFDLYSVTLYISPNKRIEITPMDVYLTLVLPIYGKKVEDFYGKKPKDAKYNEVLDA
ncbi:hypothetical protein Cgig2_021853 [Carnegiea gigantea]|uniref:Uncharacterized protein n=1 Tax=Carnegiea gigantea TaxID=171969 RepID=A0A9Q1JIM6_9CARY|nr:hypothetical protein Cgig2_021853 [Carnegiea gigantea]